MHHRAGTLFIIIAVCVVTFEFVPQPTTTWEIINMPKMTAVSLFDKWRTFSILNLNQTTYNDCYCAFQNSKGEPETNQTNVVTWLVSY